MLPPQAQVLQKGRDYLYQDSPAFVYEPPDLARFV